MVCVQFSSVQFNRSVMSNCLWPHESQHARPPCPSPIPGDHSDSCPSWFVCCKPIHYISGKIGLILHSSFSCPVLSHQQLITSYSRPPSPGPTCTSLLVLLEGHRQYQWGSFALAISSPQNYFPKITWGQSLMSLIKSLLKCSGLKRPSLTNL